MVQIRVSMKYSTDLHVYRRGSMTAVQYRDEVLDLTGKLYAAVVGIYFVLMVDNLSPYIAVIS